MALSALWQSTDTRRPMLLVRDRRNWAPAALAIAREFASPPGLLL
jgi:hypothetical protein